MTYKENKEVHKTDKDIRTHPEILRKNIHMRIMMAFTFVL